MATHSNGETIEASHINEKFDTANVDTDTSLAANSDSKVASQKAIKGYVDTKDAANVKKTGDQTVNGVKTFGSIPVLPASDPTTANQATRKEYVDNVSTLVKTGASSYSAKDTGNFNIAHGLGKTPTLVRIRAVWESDGKAISLGVFTASAQNAVSFRVASGTIDPTMSETYAVILKHANGYIKAIVSVDATNIKLNRSADYTPGGTVYIYWEAIY